MSFVLDGSVALTWCFDDEVAPATELLLDRVGESGAVVPQLWPLEVLNGLRMAERRGRISPALRQRMTAFLHDLPVVLDDATAEQAWGPCMTLSVQHSLTIYDATYLELAQRRNLPLATLDRDLRTAATKAGIDLLGQ